jgi:hypothetical protein
MMEFRTSWGSKVCVPDDQETKDKVYAALMDWYKKHESFCGESLQQSDAPQLDAICILSDIADDILCFQVGPEE